MNNDFNPFEEGWEPNPLDTKIEELKALLRAEVDEQTTHQLEYDKKLIEVRDNEIKTLKNKVSELSKELEDAKMIKESIERIKNLPISEEAKKGILGENLKEILFS